MARASIALGDASLRHLLQQVGLDAREAEVYLALVSLSVSRVTDIAKAARQQRTYVYPILRSLVTKGLAAEIERAGVIHFVAEPPERLLALVRERERELRALQPLLEGALPLLKSLRTPVVASPRVTTLHGLEGMRLIYADVLTQEFCGLFNPTGMYEAFGSNVVTQLFGEQAHLQGRDLLVDCPASRRFVSEVPRNEGYEIRLLPKSLTFGTDTMMFGESVVLFAYDVGHTIVRLECAPLADTFRSWFEPLWALGKAPAR